MHKTDTAASELGRIHGHESEFVRGYWHGVSQAAAKARWRHFGLTLIPVDFVEEVAEEMAKYGYRIRSLRGEVRNRFGVRAVNVVFTRRRPCG